MISMSVSIFLLVAALCHQVQHGRAQECPPITEDEIAVIIASYLTDPSVCGGANSPPTIALSEVYVNCLVPGQVQGRYRFATVTARYERNDKGSTPQLSQVDIGCSPATNQWDANVLLDVAAGPSQVISCGTGHTENDTRTDCSRCLSPELALTLALPTGDNSDVYHCIECAMEYCDVCDENPAECRICSSGYVLTTRHQCVCPVSNCARCGGASPSSVCELCKEGYELTSRGQCRCTIENCISCQDSPPVCAACDDGFVLSRGVCVRPAPPRLCTVAYCERCQNGTSQCLQCRDPYEVNTVLNSCDYTPKQILTDAETAGIIVGGIIGGVLAVFACMIAVCILWSRTKSQPQSEEDGIHRKSVQNPVYMFQTPEGNIAYGFVTVDAGYSSSRSYSGEFESDRED